MVETLSSKEEQNMADHMAASSPSGFTLATGKSLMPDALLTTELVLMRALCSAQYVTSKLWRSQRSYWECCGTWADVGVCALPGPGCLWCYHRWQTRSSFRQPLLRGLGTQGHRDREYCVAGGLSNGLCTAQRWRRWWHEDFDVNVGYCGRRQGSMGYGKETWSPDTRRSFFWVCIKRKCAENPLAIQR